MYTVHFLVLTEGPVGWTVAHDGHRYRVVGRVAITPAAEAAGFSQVTWYAAEDVQFHQPVMTAVNVAR
jgi:hypothetical protein